MLKLHWPSDVPVTQYSVPFLQGMLNRLVHGFHKYGDVHRKVGEADWIGCIQDRLKMYKKTGNTEWLIDVANFAQLEFIQPRHKNAHFRATSSQESPGYPTIHGFRAKSKQDFVYKHEGD